MTADLTLFDVPEDWWVYRRCPVCGCAMSRTHDYTYVVQRQVWIKIGATNKPRRRLNELARPAWRQHVLHPPDMDWNKPLTVHAVVGGDVEHELHRLFADLHDTGEWFYNDVLIHDWLREVTA